MSRLPSGFSRTRPIAAVPSYPVNEPPTTILPSGWSTTDETLTATVVVPVNPVPVGANDESRLPSLFSQHEAVAVVRGAVELGERDPRQDLPSGWSTTASTTPLPMPLKVRLKDGSTAPGWLGLLPALTRLPASPEPGRVLLRPSIWPEVASSWPPHPLREPLRTTAFQSISPLRCRRSADRAGIAQSAACVPGAPSGLAVVTTVSPSPGPAKSRSPWTAPADNGGAAITSYTATPRTVRSGPDQRAGIHLHREGHQRGRRGTGQ